MDVFHSKLAEGNDKDEANAGGWGGVKNCKGLSWSITYNY